MSQSVPIGIAFQETRIELGRHEGGERRRRSQPWVAGVVPVDRSLVVTKDRETKSIEDVLLKALGDLGRARCAEITGRSESYLLEASDPAKPQLLSAQDMVKLDIAHIGHDSTAPFHAAIGAILARARAEIYVDAVAIGRATRDVLKEDGDAHLALFIASQPEATDLDLRAALRETKEAAAAQAQAIEIVECALEKRQRQPP